VSLSSQGTFSGRNFAKACKKPEAEISVKELHAKIGQLAVENVFLSVALGRIAEPGARR